MDKTPLGRTLEDGVRQKHIPCATDTATKYSFSKGKKRAWVDIQVPQHCGFLLRMPTWVLPMRSVGESLGLDRWELDCDREGAEGLSATSIAESHSSGPIHCVWLGGEVRAE